EVWAFFGVGGEVVTVDMESDDFDPLVDLYIDRNGEYELLASDDDGGDYPLASRLIYQLPEDGLYYVVAKGFPGSEGAYDLMLDLPDPDIAGTPDLRGLQEIRAGQSIGDTLSEDDDDTAGAYFD